MKTPLLTVITPVYNGERFIESCLKSVIAQDCPYAEHLIIDGGSTDATLKIIKRYAQRYQHLHWVSGNDHGQSHAMNKGIALAQGEIIGFLNCDDYYESAILHKILEIFQTLPNPSLLVGNCNVLNDDEQIIYVNKPSRLNLTNILIGGEKNQFPFNPSAYFYHKCLHDKIGYYDEFDHYTMDLDFLLRALKTAHIQYINETWGNFRFIRGTKTFQLKKGDLLHPYKMRVMNAHLQGLPKIQRWWIKTVRFLLIDRMLHYYAGRIIDCLKNPGEMHYIWSRKFGYHPALQKRKHCVDAAMNP